MDSINQSSIFQHNSIIQPSQEKPKVITNSSSKKTKSSNSDRKKVLVAGSINDEKIKLNSQFSVMSKGKPGLKQAASTAPFTSPSQKLDKVSGNSKTNSAVNKIEKQRKVKLNKVAVQGLYSLKELNLKRRKLKEGTKKFALKNVQSSIEGGKMTATQSSIGSDSKSKIDSTSSSKSQNKIKIKTSSEYKANSQRNVGIDPKPDLKLQNNLKPDESSRFKAGNTPPADEDEDEDSDIEVEEINIVSQAQTEQAAAEMGNTQSIVISGIMKQVEELEKTLKMSVAKKESELQVEKQIVEQVKRKNEILEMRDKKRKEAMEKQSMEAANEIEKKNNEINALKMFANSMSQKLNSKEEEFGTMQTTVKKNSDLMSRKLLQKHDDLLVMTKKFEKVSSDLEELQNWKSTQIIKEKESMKKLIQGNLAKDSIYKQRMEALENNNKEKDELILKHKKSIESLNVKVGEKEQLIKDTKHKVKLLVSEFTKGFNDKEDQLKTKINEVQQSTTEIERLKSKMTVMKKDASDKDKEIETMGQMNGRQVSIIEELSKKLDRATADADKNASLQTARQEASKTFIKSLEKSNSEKDFIVDQLKNKLAKLKKIKAEGLVINNEDIFEDKLEQFVFEFYAKKETDKPLMLTYSWPVLSVHVDPCYLKKREKEDAEKKQISQVNIQVNPLMITYLWPVLSFQHKSQINMISCRGLKRKISRPSSGKRQKLSKVCLNIPSIIPISFLKTVEQIYILNVVSYYNDEDSGETLEGQNWPIVSYDQVVSRKRKFEEVIKNEAKRLKLDSELNTEEDGTNDIASSILDDLVESVHLAGNNSEEIVKDIVQLAENHSEDVVKDIVAEMVERSGNGKQKIWPVVEYRGHPTIKGERAHPTLKGKMNRDMSFKRRLNVDITDMKVSRLEGLQLLPYLQAKALFFNTVPKELNFYDKPICADEEIKSSQIIDTIWPVMLYQENFILKNLLDGNISDEHKKDNQNDQEMWNVEDNSNKDLDTSLELTLKENVLESSTMKRKCGEDSQFISSKKIRVDDSEEYSDQVGDKHLSDNLVDNWKNIEQLLNETLDYAMSFSES